MKFKMTVLVLIGTMFASIAFASEAADTSPLSKKRYLNARVVNVDESVQNNQDMPFSEKIFYRMSNRGGLKRLTYNEKYALSCFVYTFKKNWVSVDITILSTFRSKPCDPELFAQFTAANIIAQVQTAIPTDYALEAGPHAQLMDLNRTPLVSRTYSIGPMEFAPVARTSVGLFDLFLHFTEWKNWALGKTAYSIIYFKTSISFLWNVGSRIHTITTDTGQVFIMTHMTLPVEIKNELDAEACLSNLGSALNLPAGWTYTSQTLQKVLEVNYNNFEGKEYARLTDEFGNVYLDVTELINKK